MSIKLIEDAFDEIAAEIDRAQRLFPKWPNDLVEATAIVAEEAGEALKVADGTRTDGGDGGSRADQSPDMKIILRDERKVAELEGKLGRVLDRVEVLENRVRWLNERFATFEAFLPTLRFLEKTR